MFDGKGLKLFLYKEEDWKEGECLGKPYDVVDFDGLQGIKSIMSWYRASVVFLKYVQREDGEYGVKLRVYKGPDSDVEELDMFPGDTYPYYYSDVTITGPTDWYTDTYLYYLKLVKE